MLLSGCKGNTFFWKSTFFYGLIYNQIKKKQKSAFFIILLIAILPAFRKNICIKQQELQKEIVLLAQEDDWISRRIWLNKRIQMFE